MDRSWTHSVDGLTAAVTAPPPSPMATSLLCPLSSRPRRSRHWTSEGSLIGVELECDAVDAVSLAGRVGTVVEDVAQVTATVSADDLRPDHAVLAVGFRLDGLVVDGIPEARPARAGFELLAGAEQDTATPCTAKDSHSVDVDEIRCAARFGSTRSQDAILWLGQFLFLLLVGLLDRSVDVPAGHRGCQ